MDHLKPQNPNEEIHVDSFQKLVKMQNVHNPIRRSPGRQTPLRQPLHVVCDKTQVKQSLQPCLSKIQMKP
jgi:hypothetical protein